jgi:hypothetical protein
MDQPTTGAICLAPDELRALLEDAAKRGADRTLARLGLEDQTAVEDLREVRDLLSAWRSARRVAWETMVRAATVGFLAILAAGFAMHWFGNTPPRQ